LAPRGLENYPLTSSEVSAITDYGWPGEFLNCIACLVSSFDCWSIIIAGIVGYFVISDGNEPGRRVKR
jgi:hypothetical protein